jgi:hypothetical protein
MLLLYPAAVLCTPSGQVRLCHPAACAGIRSTTQKVNREGEAGWNYNGSVKEAKEAS